MWSNLYYGKHGSLVSFVPGGIFGGDMGRNGYVQGVYLGGSGFCAELKR
jgi:hypothetical protein